MIKQLTQNIYSVQGQISVMGDALDVRMTIIRFLDGNIMIFDPIAFDRDLATEIALLGEVTFIIAPNRFHYLFINEWANCFAKAQVLLAPGLKKRIASMSQHDEIDEKSLSDYQGEITYLIFDATPILNEIILFHHASRCLIITDLAFNIHHANWSLLGLYIRFSGTFKKFGLTWFLKLFVRDKPRARYYIDTILEWDFDKIIVAHGLIVEQDAKKLMRAAFQWLNNSSWN